MSLAERWAKQLGGGRQGQDGNWTCKAPCHNDKQPSYSVKDDAGAPVVPVLFHCHRDCPKEKQIESLQRLGLYPTSPAGTVRGGKDKSPKAKGKKLSESAEVYEDADGIPRHRTMIIRYENHKDVWQERYADGKWVKGLDATALVLFRLQSVIAAVRAGKPIFIAEGEAKVRLLESWGLTATCNAQGAGKWTTEHDARYGYSTVLEGAQCVYVLPDYDADGKGMKHAESVCRSVARAGIPCKLVHLPGLEPIMRNGKPKGQDVVDWAAKGNTAEQLWDLCAEAPAWTDDEVPVITSADTSQLGIARATINSFGANNIMYNASEFYQWTGSVWQACDELLVQKRVTETYEAINKSIAAQDRKEITANKIAGILKLLKSECFVPHVDFDQPSETISVQNGELTFDGTAWCLGAHRRESYRLSLIPVAYDPTAAAPRFTRFLSEIFDGDDDTAAKQQVVREFMGYSFTTHCSFQKFLLLVGEGGDNGKSKLLFVVENLLGSHNVCAIDPSYFTNSHKLAHIRGKYANLVPEIKEGFQIDDAAFKRLTSGELENADRKFKDPFDFRPFAKLWFGTNHMPHTRDVSRAFFKRPIILTFNRSFKKADDPDRKDTDALAEDPAELEAALLREMPGILNIALKGLESLRKRKGFAEPPSSVEARKQWRKDADQIEQYVEERCRIGTGMLSTFADLYSDYESWAKASGIDKKFSRKKFGQRLTSLGYQGFLGPGGTKMRSGLERDPGKRN